MKRSHIFSLFALCLCLSLLASLVFLSSASAEADETTGTTYYVSSSSGDDSYAGTEAKPFATITKVNGLDLQPGDQVRFKCGDTWRAEQLVVSHSGTAGAPIVFSSYPAGCLNKPVFSGAQPITGWLVHSGNIYRADLNAATFPLGINQLFRDGMRTWLGRWPNLDNGSAGYTYVDSHSAGSNQITDNQLPAVDWTGAIVHIKNIRWSMLDRQVSGRSGATLTLNTDLSCLVSSWGTCAGWGYFINNHLSTLDQDGEWYYDAAANRVYLYSASGAPTNIEGSVVLEEAETLRHGGIMLSDGSATAYVIIENIAIIDWFNHGIGTPGSMGSGDVYHDITVQNVTIKDVDAIGINLGSWLWNPSDGIDGFRGGYNMHFANNTIDGANHFGVTIYSAQSVFEGNTIQNIALIKNLNKSGMGCGITTGECTENGDGFRIRQHDASNSGYGNTLIHNRFEKIGYNGIDVFGPDTTLENNYITLTCFSKADCGGVRVFGNDSLASTKVHDIHLVDNIIVDIPGNVDGCEASRPPFGMGLYIDNYSRDVEVRGNTIISTTVTGILYQRSSGQIVNNTVFNASYLDAFSGHISLGGSQTNVSMTGNIMYALGKSAWTLYVYSPSGNISTSDDNYFFHPYEDEHIAHGSWVRATFAGWQSLSGKDSHSKTNWFTQDEGEESLARIDYNAYLTPIYVDLGSRQYLDLDQNPVIGGFTLPPFTSKILVENGDAPLTLLRISPAQSLVSEAADFTLTVNGLSFTTDSVVRWKGSPRPTTYVSQTELTAQISAADVSAVGEYPVTVYDPAGSETEEIRFFVWEEAYEVYLPWGGR